jgi:acyl carrier protein
MSVGRNEEQLQHLTEWLVERVAFYLDRPADSIDRDTPLAVYGMDSLYSLSVISDMQDMLGTTIDPTVIRRYSTITALSEYLRTLADLDALPVAEVPAGTW